jgi:RNA recognition motif-containing protein
VTTLFVGGLPEDTSEQFVEDIFSSVAPVASTRIIKDAAHAKCRGFAYVTIASRSDAEEAVRRIDGTSVDGCRVRVDYAT